ncbi:MAG: class I SAM-dependent methyltransferase [Ignavibacteriaceae bacterium]|nr:class I SAM-dependent methyltransferase [Ignavibacteriaceae bacterium]
MTEWFKDWFDTDEYLDVYRNRNEEDAKKLVNLILQNVSLRPEAEVLDLACGAGRHSILFAEKGFNVTAVDLSRNLLSIAKKAADESNVNVNFLRADLRQFSICTRFDLVINLFTSFGYFETDEQNFSIINTAYNQLNNAGYFVLDFFNRRYIEKNLVPESVSDSPGKKIIQRRHIEKDRVNKQIIIEKNGIIKEFNESVRMYYKDELLNAIACAGFRINRYFGDSNGKDFDLENSPRIIIIAQK